MTNRAAFLLLALLGLGQLLWSQQPAISPNANPENRWAIDLDFHWALSEMAYSYRDEDDGSRVTFNGPYNAKGIGVGGFYTHGGFRIGIATQSQHIFYWTSELITRTPYERCPTGSPCRTDTTLLILRGQERLPKFRMSFSPSIQLLPRIAPGLRAGLVLEPGFFFYPQDAFRPDRSEERLYKLGLVPKAEGGIRFLFDAGPYGAVIVTGSGILSKFDPDGYFDAVGATALQRTHRAFRLSMGYSFLF